MNGPKSFKEVLPGALSDVRPGQRDVGPPESQESRRRLIADRRALLRRQATELHREDLRKQGGIRWVGAGALSVLLGGMGRN